MIAKNFETKEKNTVSFDVTCDAAEFEKAVNAAYLKNKKSIAIPGFRKGKAPRMVIEGMYGKDVFYEDATDALAPEAFQFAVDDLKLQPVGTPSVTNIDISDAKELTLSFSTAVRPEVTLGDYKGIEAVKRPVEVTEEMIDNEIEKVRRRNARTIEVEGPAESGNTANIDYEGSVNGVPFDGGKDTGYNLVLGSGSFIPGFEDQVIGMKAGDEADINVTFPEDYHEASLAGQAAVFHVKVNKVTKEELPEVDDEFVQDVSEFDTMAAYRDSIRARIETAEADEVEDEFQTALIARAGDNMTVDIPDAMVDEQIDRMVNEYKQGLEGSGLSIDMYLQYMGQTMADFRNTCRETALRRVKTELLLDKVAEVEGIEVSAEDIEAEYQKATDQYATDLDVVKQAVPESAVVGDIKAHRAAQIIFDNAVAVDPPKAEEAPAEEAAPAEAE